MHMTQGLVGVVSVVGIEDCVVRLGDSNFPLWECRICWPLGAFGAKGLGASGPKLVQGSLPWLSCSPSKKLTREIHLLLFFLGLFWLGQLKGVLHSGQSVLWETLIHLYCKRIEIEGGDECRFGWCAGLEEGTMQAEWNLL
jgi:hypothetical protein